ncbi:SDR family oxidoreductase [Saccharothrix sp. Mg75]|uniref:SDR family oxidoreductase n=1 Tax=Saccharothrix sp. Mg75 TaxID=3445357 RepID=UPI003EECFACD
MQSGLAGKTALVTGASRGIGRAIAEAFAAEGCNVVIVSRRQESLDRVAASIRDANPHIGVLAKAAHVGEQEQVCECVAAATAEFGSIDILVNNAGTNPYVGPLVDLDVPRAAKIVQVNQLSIVLWTQAVWHASMAVAGGNVINISSVGGYATEPGIGYYNSAKAAGISLTKSFAAELAPRVRVNGIAPGVVRTRMAQVLLEGHEEELEKLIPLGRIGEPSDIAGVAVFLAGETSSWMTGQTIVVDGGALAAP